MTAELILRREDPPQDAVILIRFGAGTGAVDHLIRNSLQNYGMYQSVLRELGREGAGALTLSAYAVTQGVTIGALLRGPGVDRPFYGTAAEGFRGGRCEVGQGAAAARRSLVSLSRKLSLHAGAARPIWDQDAAAELPTVLVLVGSWSETDHDRDVAARITNRDIKEVERPLLRWENTGDPPFRRSGGNWRLVNPESDHDFLTFVVIESVHRNPRLC